MNWLFFLEVSFSGVLAGFLSWLLTPGNYGWDVLGDFQSSILGLGIFSGLFSGLIQALPPYFRDFKFKKFLLNLLSSFVTGLAVSMLGGVVFAVAGQILAGQVQLKPVVIRFFWWTVVSINLSACIGIINSDYRSMFKSCMGLTPAFIISGILADRFFIANQHWLNGCIFIGLAAAIGFFFAWETLKQSWLDERCGRNLLFRDYLETGDFLIGAGDECDLCLDSGPEQLLVISENNGNHVLEVLQNDSMIKINSTPFRYRVLVDGDLIDLGKRKFVYHSSIAKTRDVVPQAYA